MKSRLFNAIKQLNKEMASLLSEAVIFNIDNVAEYYWQSPQQHWHIEKDFPILTLPFDTCYFEYQRRIKEGDNKVERIGIVVGKKRFNTDRESVSFLVFATIKNEIGFFGGVNFWLDGKGCFVPEPGQKSHEIKYMIPKVWGNELTEEIRNSICSFLHPVWLAVSFLHCKNVTIEPRGAGLNLGKRKRHEPNCRYHVLVIEPMKKILKTEGRSDEVGLKRALHICRGHFKDFRETGLFGKFRDIYWWNPQLRGSAENGVVEKDYKVSAPHDQEDE